MTAQLSDAIVGDVPSVVLESKRNHRNFGSDIWKHYWGRVDFVQHTIETEDTEHSVD